MRHFIGRDDSRCALAMLLVGIFLVTGCQNGQGDSGEEKLPAIDGKELLGKVVETYRNAESYEDDGQLLFVITKDGTTESSEAHPFSFSFQRPNLVRWHQFGVGVVANAEKLQAAVSGYRELSGIPGQVIEVDTPELLSSDTLENLPILHSFMTQGLQGLIAPQAELLLADQRFAKIIDQATAIENLPAEQINGRTYYRLKIKLPKQERLLWIDPSSFLIRRIDFVSPQWKKIIDPSEELAQVTLRIDLEHATINKEIDPKAFVFELPQGARRVSHFVSPVSAMQPRIGESVGDFQFADLEGNPVSRKTLGEKIVVLDFWFTTCAPCKDSIPLLESVYEKFKENKKIAFLAVDIDPGGTNSEIDVDNKTVKRVFASWGGTMPIVRDLHQDAKNSFSIAAAPCLVVLDGQNRIQIFQTGSMFDVQLLEANLKRLIEGEDIAALQVEQYKAERMRFARELEKATVDQNSNLVEIQRSEIADKTRPENLQLTRLWQAPQIKAPGNILAISPKAGAPRIFVLDGWQEVVELDESGKEVGRHKLDLPERTGVSFLRTALDSEQKRYFLAAGVSQLQLHLFDQEWQKVLSYPEGSHAGIADARFARYPDDKLGMVVSYWGTVGVQGVSLAGQRIWSNRLLEDVMHVAVAPNNKSPFTVYATNSRGTLVPIDEQGNSLPDIRISKRRIIGIASQDLNSDGQPELCALSDSPVENGKITAIGLTPTGKELWSYDLPKGYHQNVIEKIVPVSLASDDGGWLIPAPDGSIHLLTSSGQLVDRFNYGEELTGLQLALIDNTPVLLVSTAEGFTAWKLAPY